MRPLVEPEERNSVTLAEWKTLVGSPARLTLSDSRSHDGTVKIPGTIRDASPVGITIELFFPLLTPRIGSPVVLEVMAKNALLQCHTTIQHSSNPQCVHVVFPDEIHRIDRRQFPRFSVSVSATILPRKGEWAYEALITNISGGGCAAALSIPLTIGTPVRLEFHNIGLHPAQLEAQVVRCSLLATPVGRWELGLSFYNITEEQRKYLDGYVKP